ncbi:MAG TPA: hypothetical protein VJS44_06670 [Pyrinomonadaceae bacterium]|nr:hypothetical protein [Pyrinomonadaceae bacterium]
MIEIGIGVLFAILFVAAYLIVSRLFGGGRLREISNQHLPAKLIAPKPPALSLKTGEMSEHHSKKQ